MHVQKVSQSCTESLKGYETVSLLPFVLSDVGLGVGDWLKCNGEEVFCNFASIVFDFLSELMQRDEKSSVNVRMPSSDSAGCAGSRGSGGCGEGEMF